MTDETKIFLKDINVQLPASELIDKLYKNLSDILEGEKINTTNVVLIATNLIQIVERYPELKGVQKKLLLIHVLKRFVKDNLDGEEETAVLTFIDLFLPSVIDTIISVDKKEIAIKMKKSFKICFPCCFKKIM